MPSSINVESSSVEQLPATDTAIFFIEFSIAFHDPYERKILTATNVSILSSGTKQKA
jgi:hypothetical protein